MRDVMSMSVGDKISLTLITCKLLRGLVKGAERVVDEMEVPELGVQRINHWKKEWAGIPHGQWDGGV